MGRERRADERSESRGDWGEEQVTEWDGVTGTGGGVALCPHTWYRVGSVPAFSDGPGQAARRAHPVAQARSGLTAGLARARNRTGCVVFGPGKKTRLVADCHGEGCMLI